MAAPTGDQSATQYYQPPYRPYSRSNAIREPSRGYMSEWQKMQNRVDIAPAYQAKEPAPQAKFWEGNKGSEGKGPKQIQYEAAMRSQSAPDPPTPSVAPLQEPVSNASATGTPYKAFVDPGRQDDYYNRYMRLSQNVAYRYPDPGPPREREGAIGGSWRHIKEVLGQSGSRVVFVDGLVSLYDIDKRTLGRKSLPMRGSTPLYSATRHDSASYGQILRNDLEKQSYQPWEDKITNSQPLPAVNNTTKELPNSPSKYKGFYTMRQ